MKNFEGNFTDKILLKFGTDVIILLKQILYTRARNNYFDGVIKDFMVSCCASSSLETVNTCPWVLNNFPSGLFTKSRKEQGKN